MSQTKQPLFLLDGMRFKLSFNELECDECGHPMGRECAPLDQYATDLQGRWVALVPADNDRHLELLKLLQQREELLTALETAEKYIHDDFVAAGIGQVIDRVKKNTLTTGSKAKDAERLDWIAAEYIKVDPFDMPTGGGDADVGWRLSQYHCGKPSEVTIHEHYKDDLRAAIDAAIAKSTGGEE